MKIILISVFPPYRGGISTHSSILYKNLINQSHNVLAINYSRQYPSFLFPGKNQLDSNLKEVEIKSQKLVDTLSPKTWKKTSDIIIKKAKHNLGYAGGCNLGAENANGEYLLFLNNSLAATSRHIEISFPFLNPEFSIDFTINFNASSFLLIKGANPPSSPTDVEFPLFLIKDFKLLITKKHILIASVNDFALSGLIINS